MQRRKLWPQESSNRKNGVFAIRILGECGIFTAKQLRAVEEVSERYGNGVVTATSRGTFEITAFAKPTWKLPHCT